MKKLLFLCAIVWGIGLGTGAQSDYCIVIGTVSLQGTSGQGIEGVRITCVEHPGTFKLTDENGDFQISIPKNSSLTATYQGYHVSDGPSTTGPYTEIGNEWNFQMAPNPSSFSY